MIDSFAELLEKKKYKAIGLSSPQKDMILLEDLGEWAWENFKQSNCFVPENIDSLDFNHEQNLKNCIIQFLEIAIACLGKTEIEKRLKELKK